MVENDDSRRTLGVTLDQTFGIELMAESAAGYEWIPIYDGEAISYLGQETVAVSVDGAAGAMHARRRLSFRALMPGEHALELLYKRRWERTVTKRLTFLLQVHVTP